MALDLKPLDRTDIEAPDPLADPPAPPPEPVVVQATQTHRVSAADIEELRSWLIPRLMRAHPDRNYRALHVFLVQTLTSNEALFVRNDRAVALALIRQRWLNPPQVVELFCFAIGHPGRDMVPDDDAHLNGEAAASAATLYPAIVSWARGMGVKQCLLLENSDATQRTTEKVVGPVLRGSYLVVNAS